MSVTITVVTQLSLYCHIWLSLAFRLTHHAET